MKTGFLAVMAVAVTGLMLAGSAPADAAAVPAAKSVAGTVESGLTPVKGKPGSKSPGKSSGKMGGKFSGKSHGHHGRHGHHRRGRDVVPFLVIEGILDAAAENR
jgi:hypothetical protein